MTDIDSNRAVPAPAAAASSTGTPPNDGSNPIAALATRGASFLFGREAIGSVVRLVGVIVVVREMGPSNYGIFTAAAAFTLVVVTICQMGAEVYLIRVPEEPTTRLNNEVFSLLFVTSVLAMGIALALTYLCEGLLRPHGVTLPLRILLLSIPINVMWAPAQAHIERRFDYKKMGFLELGGDIVLYATAIPLALLHFGYWSLVVATFTWQAYLLVGSLVLSGLRPRWAWSFRTARTVAIHGTSFSSATLGMSLANAVNPLVVGAYAGAAGVGYVSLAQNLVSTIGFAKRGAYRLGIVTMARLHRDDPGNLRKGFERGAFLLAFGLAVPFAAFGLFAHWIIPDIFGHEWGAAVPVYCYLALACLFSTIGMIEASFFYARGQNTTVAFAAFLQTAILAVTSVGLVRLWGVDGFGVASLLALVAYVWLDRRARRVTTFTYRYAVAVMLIAAPSMFIPLVPFPLGLALLAPWLLLLAVAPLRREVFDLWRALRTSLRKQPAS